MTISFYERDNRVSSTEASYWTRRRRRLRLQLGHDASDAFTSTEHVSTPPPEGEWTSHVRRQMASSPKREPIDSFMQDSASPTASADVSTEMQDSTSEVHRSPSDCSSSDDSQISRHSDSFWTDNVSDDSTASDNFNTADVDTSNGPDAEQNDDSSEGCLREELARWATRHLVSHECVTDLLKMLRRHNVPGLPVCARTLLKTPRHIVVQEQTGGQYYHFGLKKSICYVANYDNPKLQQGDTLKLQINIDGLPVNNSNNDHLWPILGLIECDSYRSAPFCIGMFYSRNAKAGLAQEFLHDFIQEYIALHRHGLTVLGVDVKLNLSSVICDAPAMAFVKEIKLHSGYGACFKCEERGVKQGGRMTFANMLSRLRTDHRFRNKVDTDHQKPNVTSPFVQIDDLDMIEQFLYDYMHVVLLNVVKRLMKAWVYGPEPFKIDGNFVDVITARLLFYAKSCPTEFGRRPRSLKHLRHFKATEFRSFLCYTGFAAALGVLKTTDYYYNFLLLSCAMRILLNPALSDKFHAFAKKLLRAFVKHYTQLYGEDRTVFSVHALIHLPRQAAQYGHLDKISSFPYESYLYKLKQLIRKPGCTLKQVVARLYEQRHLNMPASRLKSNGTKYMLEHNDGPVPQERLHRRSRQYKAVVFRGVKYSCKRRDSAVMVCGEKVAVIRNILLHEEGHVFAVVQLFGVHENQFTEPMPSRIVGVHRCSKLDEALSVVRLSDCRKVWLMPAQNGYFLAVELNNDMAI